MPENSFDHILEQINTRDSEAAWALFLTQYAAIILQAVKHFERDSDFVPDCFQYVCEQLSANSFRRLRKFQPRGPAVFSTWLRAVVRNLCLDWRRKRFGRRRFFNSIARLSVFDQEVFRHLHERQLSLDDAFHSLRTIYPTLTHAQLEESNSRINSSLTAKQSRLLAARQANPEQHAVNLESTAVGGNIPDPSPDPEALALLKERAATLRQALGRLPSRERLLIRLRYEQELKLEQIADLLDLGNAQRAERQIKAVLLKLREELD
jgi:RNA polymerase sigma factor (sigma-70 family)